MLPILSGSRRLALLPTNGGDNTTRPLSQMPTSIGWTQITKPQFNPQGRRIKSPSSADSHEIFCPVVSQLYIRPVRQMFVTPFTVAVRAFVFSYQRRRFPERDGRLVLNSNVSHVRCCILAVPHTLGDKVAPSLLLRSLSRRVSFGFACVGELSWQHVACVYTMRASYMKWRVLLYRLTLWCREIRADNAARVGRPKSRCYKSKSDQSVSHIMPPYGVVKKKKWRLTLLRNAEQYMRSSHLKRRTNEHERVRCD